MLLKFRITFEDGTTMESHDEMWNEVRSHAHALHPHNEKKWTSYEILSDEGKSLGVNFLTGQFTVNGQVIRPMWDGMEGLHTPFIFPVTEEWSILNGLPYFPIVGRRTYYGNYGAITIMFCGWKRRIGESTIEMKMGMYPDGSVGMVE